ncbi:hypothetical protein [Hydrogenivirga sp. 128-5-R1-1]|uniref:hypothetical protein n=1 Tax=Hydrogenivirga sp. 128-5-R1-1 TaxID=392423 RepID=UPI00015F30A9|nr:hypothetical protein [Hydrogenivirga sp. 128-5-R1-1]EDP74471.1 hypothetical protein HG1285_09891 [Hydrogenivirga sp. 128-5-R1-1]
MTYPRVIEEEDRIIVIYSNEPIHSQEEDEGILLFYDRKGDIVKIIIPKDDEHHLIFL